MAVNRLHNYWIRVFSIPYFFPDQTISELVANRRMIFTRSKIWAWTSGEITKLVAAWITKAASPMRLTHNVRLLNHSFPILMNMPFVFQPRCESEDDNTNGNDYKFFHITTFIVSQSNMLSVV